MSVYGGSVNALPGLVTRPGQYLGGPAGYRADGVVYSVDRVDGGTLEISGSVYIDATPDIPVARRVRLYDLPSGRLIRETWSDPVTGAYRFAQIRAGIYTVIGYDHTGAFNAVVRDRVEPVVTA